MTRSQVGSAARVRLCHRMRVPSSSPSRLVFAASAGAAVHAPAGDDADVINEADIIHARMLREKLGKGSGAVEAITSSALAGAKEAAAEDRADMEELIDSPPPRRTALDHCSHLQHLALALAALGRDPAMAEVQRGTSHEVLTKLAAMVAASEAQAASGVPAGQLGPAPPGTEGK